MLTWAHASHLSSHIKWSQGTSQGLFCFILTHYGQDGNWKFSLFHNGIGHKISEVVQLTEAQVTQIFISELNHDWFRWWLGAYLVSMHYLNHYWLCVSSHCITHCPLVTHCVLASFALVVKAMDFPYQFVLLSRHIIGHSSDMNVYILYNLHLHFFTFLLALWAFLLKMNGSEFYGPHWW